MLNNFGISLLLMQLIPIPVTKQPLLYTKQTFSLPVVLLVGQSGLLWMHIHILPLREVSCKVCTAFPPLPREKFTFWPQGP